MAMYHMCAAAEGFIDIAFKMFGYLDSGRVGAIYKGFQVVSWTVLALTVIYLGYKLIMGKKVKIKDSVFYVIILTSLMINLPGIMNKTVALNKTLYNESKSLVTDEGTSNSKNQSVAFNIIRTNVADLEYLASEGYDTLSNPDSVKNKITEKNLKYVDFQEILLPEDINKLASSTKNDEAKSLGKYIALDAQGKMTEKDIENGWFTLFEEGTFRYGANNSAMNVSFIVLTVFFFMQFCKFIIIIVDLVNMKIYAPLVLMSDIETAKKSKQMMLDIFGAIFSIAALGISTVLFNSFYNYLVGLKVNLFAFFIIGVLGAVGFIKGSDSVAKYFGINTSVKDGIIGAMGMLGAVKAGQAVAPVAGEVVSNVAKGTKDIAQKSYQKASEGIPKVANGVGNAMGHVSERGFGGAVKDKLADGKDAVTDTVKDKAGQAKSAVTSPLNEVKNNFEDGKMDGVVAGHSKRASELQKSNQPTSEKPLESAQSINDDPVRFSNTPPSPSDVDDLSKATVQSYQPSVEESAKTNTNEPVKANTPTSSGSNVEGISEASIDSYQPSIEETQYQSSSDMPLLTPEYSTNTTSDRPVQPTTQQTSTQSKNGESSSVSVKPTKVTTQSSQPTASTVQFKPNKYDGFFDKK